MIYGVYLSYKQLLLYRKACEAWKVLLKKKYLEQRLIDNRDIWQLLTMKSKFSRQCPIACRTKISSFTLRPGQTHATFQRNFLQHCCAQRVTRVWPPCCNMLEDVGWCWIKFENGQIFVATFLDVARCCARLASSFTTRSNNVVRYLLSLLLWNVACVWPGLYTFNFLLKQ